jgi:hypothetical protein
VNASSKASISELYRHMLVGRHCPIRPTQREVRQVRPGG